MNISRRGRTVNDIAKRTNPRMWACELPHQLQLHQGNETSINVVSSTKRSMEISSVCDSIEIVVMQMVQVDE